MAAPGRPSAAAPLDRAPTKAHEVWVHIDRFDKPNRRVWALQYLKHGRPVYQTATAVLCLYGFLTEYRADRRQPKAWIVISPAVVRWHGSVAYIERPPVKERRRR